jgi:23S rRNA (adenine2030-N6)-methyltransferase
MFSYRHAYHAGNHADVLKHTVLVAVMKHLALKEVGFTAIDTHAGAGMYRLDSADANQSGEAQEGLLALMRNKSKLSGPMADVLLDYRKLLDHFNREGGLLNYPGSPMIAHHLLREQDKLKLFEMHPTDIRALQTNVDALKATKTASTACPNFCRRLPAAAWYSLTRVMKSNSITSAWWWRSR